MTPEEYFKLCEAHDWDYPKDFKAWAQSRARTLVAKIEEQS